MAAGTVDRQGTVEAVWARELAGHAGVLGFVARFLCALSLAVPVPNAV
jgi:hypothetical protein